MATCLAVVCRALGAWAQLAETDVSANWMHWHQMSDILDHIDSQALTEAHAFTWQILKEIDQGAYNKL